jgi:hypothetical protein
VVIDAKEKVDSSAVFVGPVFGLGEERQQIEKSTLNNFQIR